MNPPAIAPTPPQGVSMSDAELLTECKWILERQLQWIAAAEVKIGVLATIELAMVAGLGAIYMEAEQRSAWIVGSTVAFGLSAVATLFCAGIALTPRVKGPATSLIFFGRVAALSAADYAVKLGSAQHQGRGNRQRQALVGGPSHHDVLRGRTAVACCNRTPSQVSAPRGLQPPEL
jgi:hypothetical protein